MNHSHHDHHASSDRGRLTIVLGLTSVVLVVEAIGGFLTGSLALVADAGHMLTDVAGLGLALFAMKLAERPPTPERTYGYHRAEILAALLNAMVLVAVSAGILVEAWERFRHPTQVRTGLMLLIAVVGLLANLVGVALLRRGAGRSLNLKGAYFEVLSDLLASVGVIAAAAAIRLTSWAWIDPAVSVGIGLFILPRTWHLVREALGILLEGTPDHIDLGDVEDALLGVPGVSKIHDLHVWTLTSHRHVLTAHAVIDAGSSDTDALAVIHALADERFGIDHVTVQIERAACPAGSACAALGSATGHRLSR